MNEIHVTVSGRLVADPESRTTKTNGIPFTAFRLASSSRRFNPTTQAFEDSPASYVNVTAFRALGLNAAGSLEKGQPVIVHGRMRVNQFTRGDGTMGTSVEIDAYGIGHDLTFGTTAFEKASRAQNGAQNGAQNHPNDRLSDESVQEVHSGLEERDPETDEFVVDDGTAPFPGPGLEAVDDSRRAVLTPA